MAAVINELAAHWWAERLELPEKRPEFEVALIEVLNRNPDWGKLYVDYDPEGELLEALYAIGVDCKRVLFSADGIFPTKTGLFKDDGRLFAKDGYGAPHVKIGDIDNGSEESTTEG